MLLSLCSYNYNYPIKLYFDHYALLLSFRSLKLVLHIQYPLHHPKILQKEELRYY